MLWFGLKALARNAGAFTLFLGIDVVGQAALVWAVPIESAGRLLWMSSLVLSLLLHLVCASYVLYCAAAAGRDPSRRWSVRDVLAGGGGRLFRVAASLAAVGTVVAVGLWIYTWLGVAVLLALGLVPLAAAAGDPNPVAGGLTALARNALRYAWVVVAGTVVLGAVSTAVALVALYWPTPLAQVVVLCGEGAVLVWLVCSLAPLYARTAAGRAPAVGALGVASEH